MEPKYILIPFGGQDHELAALETAFDLAKKWKAHAAVWHILPNPEEIITPIAAFGLGAYYFPDEHTFAELMKLNEESKKEVQRKFLKTIKKLNIEHEDNPSRAKGASASLHIATGHPEKIISSQGRLADLIVISRIPDLNMTYSEVVNAALFNTGRPVLLMPPGDQPHKFSGNTVVAWNGSREAARAVSAAFPFLKKGKIWALTGESDHWKDTSSTSHELSEYLKLHGIEAEALSPWINHTPLPDIILGSAKKLGADLIVMGAFGHSRLREMVMGGVTEHMLKSAGVPVLMMH